MKVQVEGQSAVRGFSRRSFIGGLASLGAVAGCRSAGRLAGESPLVRFGVVSDVHVRLADDGVSLAAGYDTETLERTFAYFRDSGADAVVIAGDMADSGLLGELKAVAGAWYKVFPNDRAPDGRRVERLFVFGNHDACGLRNGGRVFKDAAALRREAIDADPKGAWDACFHEEWKPYYVKNVKGFDFFCSHWQPGVWCNGIAETGSSGCADAFRGRMERCDPSKPFFYVQHAHPRGTVYGSCAWGVDDGTATRLLSAFPQAVSFSGHSHEPLTNEKSMWRGAFTSVATGSLRYLSANAVWNFARTAGYENGGCNYYLPGVTRQDRSSYVAKYDAPKTMPSELSRHDIRVGQLVSVYGDRIVFERREFVSGLSLGEDWVVERPARPLSFSARASAARLAEFPADARLVVGRVVAKTRGMKRADAVVPPEDIPALRLSFPAATAGGCVAEYEVSALGADGAKYDTRVCAVGGLYPRRHANFARGVVATIRADALPPGASEIKVAPLDSFGRAGRALSASLA